MAGSSVARDATPDVFLCPRAFPCCQNDLARVMSIIIYRERKSSLGISVTGKERDREKRWGEGGGVCISFNHSAFILRRFSFTKNDNQGL